MAKLSEIIERQMKAKGLQPVQVAALMKLTERSIEYYISGERTPSYKNLVELSKVLDFNLTELSELPVPRETQVKEEQAPYVRHFPKYEQGFLHT